MICTAHDGEGLPQMPDLAQGLQFGGPCFGKSGAVKRGGVLLYNRQSNTTPPTTGVSEGRCSL